MIVFIPVKEDWAVRKISAIVSGLIVFLSRDIRYDILFAALSIGDA